MSAAFLGLGSNLGDRPTELRQALRDLRAHGGVRLRAVSRFRRTDPVGGPPQPDFVNAVARVESSLPPEHLLSVMQRVEHRRGRRRGQINGPRTLDLDLLWYENAVLQDERLTLPHPRLEDRRFVLEPLAELAPGLITASGRPVEACLRACAPD